MKNFVGILLTCFVLIGCFLLGWIFGIRHMRHQAVSFKVATWQADENGAPNFVWKNMENK